MSGVRPHPASGVRRAARRVAGGWVYELIVLQLLISAATLVAGDAVGLIGLALAVAVAAAAIVGVRDRLRRRRRRDQADVGLCLPGRGGQGGGLRVHPLGVGCGPPPARFGALTTISQRG